jgi:diguanylate cyclase (GGDEF)-like protein
MTALMRWNEDQVPLSGPPDESAACADHKSAAALDALAAYDVLDTPTEEAFDRLTRLVRRIFSTPIATVTFLDGHRQWFKSHPGLEVSESARNVAFCRIPVMEGRPLVVPDALADPRFCDNPLVVGPPGLRFYAGAPLQARDGAFIGTLCAMDVRPRSFGEHEVAMLVDLARLVESELELRVLATTDALTGLVSRRAFFDEGGRALKLAQRHRYDLSCVCFDLDHFKAVNDTVGHAAGDAALSATAKTCSAMLRKSDIFGRIGGEEFAILLPHTGVAEAAAVAEKLRAAIEAQAGASKTPCPPVTASFGVASLPAATTDLTALLAAADAALYGAKARGRNCCVVGASPEAPVSRRVLKAGSIVFNFGGSVIDCTVRRLSKTGARLDVVSSRAVPKQFKLSIEADGFSKACEVVRKEERFVEVAFA